MSTKAIAFLVVTLIIGFVVFRSKGLVRWLVIMGVTAMAILGLLIWNGDITRSNIQNAMQRVIR
jgi:hypothetical protein